MTNFLRNIKAKGWTAKEVGERWVVKPRQTNNIRGTETLSYSFFYEDMVERTGTQMVKPEYLK